VGRSNVTMLLPDLEKAGLLRREGDLKDKRIIRLHLTPDGEKRLIEALKVYSELIERVMSQSSPAQCDAMGEQMRRIEEMLGREE
ncbi:MAG TPA: MarR family transcriptional regulator, partial [Rhabdaerophilum sp.]|nr:MarR family transcriptional regulator [Rhabdaerophilum sp.]